MKTNFNTRKFKGGAYTTAISAIVIVMVVIVNLIFTRLNITVDLTSDGKFSITEETVTMLSGLEDEITFYYLAPSGEEIDLFDKILSQYTKYSDKITLVKKDPIMNPKFASRYTAQQVEEFSIIVVNEANGRSRYVAYSDMLIEEYGMDYNTYQYYSEVTGLDMEGQLNSAIGYVTMEHLPTLYETSGHGMQELGTEVISMLEKANIAVNYGDNALDLLTTAEIPQDCDVLLIHAPQTDFTESEVELLANYMNHGGNLIFVLSYMNSEHPNLMGLVNDYGILLEDGVLLEGNAQNYLQYPTVISAKVVMHDITSDVYLSKYVIAQCASGMTFAENARETLTQRAFLTTSSEAYIKDVDFESYYKENGDPSGTYYLGAYVEDSENGAELVVFSDLYMINDVYASQSTYGNINLLINSVNALADVENTTAAVRTISLVEDDYLVLTDAQINLIGSLTVILLPLGLLVCGIVWVVYRRKHA